MTTRTPERARFLSDLLTDAAEGGYMQWAEFVAVERSDDLSVTKIVVRDSVEPIGDEPMTWTATIDTVAKGLGLYRSGALKFSYYDEQFRLANRTNGEEGDYDAIHADAMLQAGLFGEVVYG